MYGLTEAGTAVIVYDYTRDRNGVNKIGSSGRGAKDLEIKVKWLFQQYIIQLFHIFLYYNCVPSTRTTNNPGLLR